MTEISLALLSVVMVVNIFLFHRAIERVESEARLQDDTLRSLSRQVHELQKQLARRKKGAQP